MTSSRQPTTRHAAFALVLAMIPLAFYLLTADWTFKEMRDGTPVGGFPLVYLGIMLITAISMAFGSNAHQPIKDISAVTPLACLRIMAFSVAAALLAFNHQAIGFVLLAVAFVFLVSILVGLRSLVDLIFYSLVFPGAVYLLFLLLGIHLTVAPPLLGF